MLLINAKVLGKEGLQQILIKNGKIVEIEPEITANRDSEFDCKGNYVVPGMIDLHVHMRTPGFTHKEDFVTGSKACARGGITTFIDMPNTNPMTIDSFGLKVKRELAAENSIVNYGFHFGGSSDDNAEEIKKAEGVLSTKIFLNESTGKMLIEEDNVVDRLVGASRAFTVHAEGDKVATAIEIAKRNNKMVYLAHISQKSEIEVIREAKKSYDKIYAEVTPHHLFLDETMQTPLRRMKPELKTKEDVDALWEAIADGTLDTIGTDHAPHTIEEKNAKLTWGVPGVETAVPLLLDAVNKGRLTLEKLVELYSTTPAKVFNIQNKGKLEAGYDADITILDMDKEFTIKDEDAVSKCGWSPFNGFEIKGDIYATFVGGKIVYKDGEFFDNSGKEVELGAINS